MKKTCPDISAWITAAGTQEQSPERQQIERSIKMIEGGGEVGLESGGGRGGGEQGLDSEYVFKVMPRAPCLKLRHK